MKAAAALRALAAVLCAAMLLSATWYLLYAAALTRVSDLISTSLPSASSTHMIAFTATQAIPPLGQIVITPQPGAFDIPADFDYLDIDLAVSDGGAFIDRSLSAAASTTADEVAVVAGATSSITFTLASSGGINAGERVRIELGTNATYEGDGDTSIPNPAEPGSYRVTVATKDAGGFPLDGAQAMIAIVPSVTVTAINENSPPLRSNGLPSGEVAAGNGEIEISLETNELATCRYSLTAGVDYDDMANTLTSVGGTLFYTVLTGFQNATTYTYYVRCADVYGTANDDDYAITFTLAPNPISNTSIQEPGSSGDNAPSDSEGPFPNGVDTLYRSTVKLSGVTSPQSTVTILKDGAAHSTAQAGSDGSFSATVASLERGSYTFLAYAQDRANRTSSSYASTLSVTQGTTNSLSDIIIPPTIGLQEEVIEVGAAALVQGEGVPNSTIEVVFTPARGGGAARTMRTTAAASGEWEVPVEAGALSRGVHQVRARAILSEQVRSDQSAVVLLGVGESPSDEDLPASGVMGDLNGDGKVNLVDFSILLSAWGPSDAPADLNTDGSVNLADFSILLFNWTG